MVSVSRLVPRKGMDILIRAAARLAPVHPDLEVVIGGTGRDRDRLERLVDRAGRTRSGCSGRVDDDDLPGLYGRPTSSPWTAGPGGSASSRRGSASCSSRRRRAASRRWRATAAVPPRPSSHGETGLVVDDPSSVAGLADALRSLIVDPELRRRMGQQARARAEASFSYDVLAAQLRQALDGSGFR